MSEIEELFVANDLCKVNITHPVVGDGRVQLLALASVPADEFVFLHQALQSSRHVFIHEINTEREVMLLMTVLMVEDTRWTRMRCVYICCMFDLKYVDACLMRTYSRFHARLMQI